MKRRKLVQHLEKHGCILVREGSNHTIYENPSNNHRVPIPRHNEIADTLAKKICQQLDIPPIK